MLLEEGAAHIFVYVCAARPPPFFALVHYLHLILSKAQDGLQLDTTSHQIPLTMLF